MTQELLKSHFILFDHFLFCFTSLKCIFMIIVSNDSNLMNKPNQLFHKLMFKYILFAFSLFILGCELNESDLSDQQYQKIMDKDTITNDEGDSLGFPTYYTHPEISKLSDLKKILERANKVMAYNFNGNNGNPANVECYDLYNNGELCPSAINKRKLNRKQINQLIDISCDTTTYDGNWSGLAGVCFIPHVGFGFFKDDSLIGQVNICFICKGIRTRPYYKSDGLTQIGIEKYYKLVKSLNLLIVDGSEKLSH